MARALPITEARLHSRCGLCDETIHPGEEIVRLPDDAEFVHVGCAAVEGYRVDEDEDA